MREITNLQYNLVYFYTVAHYKLLFKYIHNVIGGWYFLGDVLTKLYLFEQSSQFTSFFADKFASYHAKLYYVFFILCFVRNSVKRKSTRTILF